MEIYNAPVFIAFLLTLNTSVALSVILYLDRKTPLDALKEIKKLEADLHEALKSLSIVTESSADTVRLLDQRVQAIEFHVQATQVQPKNSPFGRNIAP